MNMPIHFNTLEYARKLGDAGLSPDQAEAQAQALAEVLGEATVTPGDLLLLKTDLLARIDISRNEMQAQLSALRTEMQTQISALRAEMLAEIAALRAEMRAEIATWRAEMRAEIATLRSEMLAGRPPSSTRTSKSTWPASLSFFAAGG